MDKLGSLLALLAACAGTYAGYDIARMKGDDWLHAVDNSHTFVFRAGINRDSVTCYEETTHLQCSGVLSHSPVSWRCTVNGCTWTFP